MAPWSGMLLLPDPLYRGTSKLKCFFSAANVLFIKLWMFCSATLIFCSSSLFRVSYSYTHSNLGSTHSLLLWATGLLQRSCWGLSALLTQGHHCGRGEHDSFNFPTQEFSLRGSRLWYGNLQITSVFDVKLISQQFRIRQRMNIIWGSHWCHKHH